MIALFVCPACTIARDPLATNQPNEPDTALVAEGQYRTIDLGTLGGTSSVPIAINEAGQIAGVSNTADGASHAFLWKDGRMRDLGTLGGGNSEAHAISAGGQVAGASMVNGRARVFLWNNGTMRDLGPDNAVFVVIRQVDDAGDVVATVLWLDGRVSSMVWRAGVMQDLGSLSSAEPETYAYGADEAGLVVGQSLAFTAGPTAFFHPFLWDGTELRDLGSLGPSGDASYCEANQCSHGLSADVNAAGQVVGWSTDSAGIVRGFVWENGAMRDLGGFAGLSTWAVSVNRGGQIAGEYSADFYTDLRAFIWEGGAGRDLGSLGGGLTGVLAINDEGLVAGYSRTPNGSTHAFMWRTGRMYDLGPGSPTALNERGDIAGVTSKPPGPERAVLWRRLPRPTLVASGP